MTTPGHKPGEVSRELKKHIRSIPDFPVKGILFRDITPLLSKPQAMRMAVEAMLVPFRHMDVEGVAGIEARGFIFGALLAQELQTAFIPIRKAGKLPYETHRTEYELEYGRAVLEIHRDAARPGQRIILVDDLLATGGTSRASVELLKKTGAEVIGASYLIELAGLDGRAQLSDLVVHSVIEYDD